MPELNDGKPGDGTQGAAGTGDAGNSGAGNAGGAGAPPPDAKTFTQAELDAILRERLARAVPADYEDLKGKAAKYDEAQTASKSELEKANEAKAKAEKERDDALSRANATLVRAAVMTEASAQNAVDPATVVALLTGNPAIVVKDGEVEGAKDAVKALLKEKTFLVKSAGSSSGGEFGGNDKGTLDEQIAELERAGKFKEARELKIRKGLGTA